MNNLSEDYKGVILDKDGTLIALDELWPKVYASSFKRLVTEYQMPVDHVKALERIGIVEGVMACDGIAAMAKVEDVLQEMIGDYLLHKGDWQIILEKFEFMVFKEIKANIGHVRLLHPIVMPTLEKWKRQGRVLGLVTTDSRTNTIVMLKHLGMENVFSYIGCGDDPVHSKPHPAHAEQFMQTFNLHPSQVVMIGDSPFDEMFSLNAGIGFIGINEAGDWS